MNKKKVIIFIGIILIIIVIVMIKYFVLIKEKEIKINKKNFPEELVRKVAIKADKNNNGILSKKEAGKVKELYFKKLQSSDLADVLEVDQLPSYTNADFSFDFEGIQHFYNTTKLTINLADGEFFNKESEEEQIFVKTSNLEKIYELKNLKSIHMYEVELESIDIQKFPKLEKLNLHAMYNMKELVLKKHNKINYLWVSNMDHLERVDLSSVPSLKKVYIRDNTNLQTIKFGKDNTKVEEFNIMYLPKLQNIDLSFCTNLKTLYIRKVPITSLDVSKNMKLDRVGFFQLSLDTLDLRNNKKLTYLINDSDSLKNIIIPDDNILSWVRWINSDIDRFPFHNLNSDTLIGIDIQGTKIKEFDITPYPNLENLYYDKEITTIIGNTSNIKSIVK